MLNGTYDDVYKEAMNCLESSKNREGGFILSTGCEVPFDAPIKNMIALRDAVEAFSI
jgi:uroporphyrinogen-III decarboxylase